MLGKLLERFSMTSCNSARNPIEVNLKLIKDETKEDVEETVFKHIIGRYVKGTAYFEILFPTGKQKTDVEGLELAGFTKSDHGCDCVKRKRQPVIALSNCEAVYIAESYIACQGVWLHEVLRELILL